MDLSFVVLSVKVDNNEEIFARHTGRPTLRAVKTAMNKMFGIIARRGLHPIDSSAWYKVGDEYGENRFAEIWESRLKFIPPGIIENLQSIEDI